MNECHVGQENVFELIGIYVCETLLTERPNTFSVDHNY